MTDDVAEATMEFIPQGEPIVTFAEPDAPRRLGAVMAATFLGALGSLPPEWPDQARVTISLELVRCIAAGQLAGQLAPLPPPGPNGNGGVRMVDRRRQQEEANAERARSAAASQAEMDRRRTPTTGDPYIKRLYDKWVAGTITQIELDQLRTAQGMESLTGGAKSPRAAGPAPTPGAGIIEDLRSVTAPAQPGGANFGSTAANQRFGGRPVVQAPGGTASSDIDEMRRQANRPPPPLSQPTPGLGGLQGDPRGAPADLLSGSTSAGQGGFPDEMMQTLGATGATGAAQRPGPSWMDQLGAGANAAFPGLASTAGALGGIGAAIGGAFNYSPNAAPSPVSGAPGPALAMAPSATSSGLPSGGQESPYPAGFEMTTQNQALAPALRTATGGPPALSSGTSLTAPAGGSSLSDPLAGITGLGRSDEAVRMSMLNDPEDAVALAFRKLGIDPHHNRFAQMTIERYGPALTSLANVWSWVATGSPDGADAAETMPEFLKYFMSGGDVRGIMKQAFDMAASEPTGAMATSLAGLGEEGLAQMGAATSGVAGATRNAQSRLLRDRLQNRRLADLENPAAASDTAFLEDIRRTYGL